MPKKNSAELVGFDFESDDLEYLMKHKASKNIIEKQDDSLLPETMYEEILIKIPAHYLYQELRLVCKAWNDIISRKNFILDNFSWTKPVFLVQCDISCRRSYCMEIDEQQLSYKMPEFGFDPYTNLFKVVHIHDLKLGFEIFTIGGSSNEWKTVPGPWKDLSKRRVWSSGWSDPVSINGRFLHWNVLSYEYIVSMDVSNEKCIEIKLPYSIDSITEESEFNLVELGGHLACVYSALSTQMDIWILQDFDSKLWLKKHSVHAKMIISSINPVPSFTQICPFGGTSTNGVLVFTHTKRRIYIYDTKKRTMKKHVSKTEIDKLIVHRSSLFRLQNGSCYKN